MEEQVWAVTYFSLPVHFFLFVKRLGFIRASLVAQTVKNLPAVQDTQGSILATAVAIHFSILAWRIP